MSGIRINWVPRECTEKDIKAHFANPNNGGGEIKAIYYPLFKSGAVVIFEDEITAQTTEVHEHKLLDEVIIIEILPCRQVFTTLDATLDATVAAFLQTDEDVRDEIQYNGGVEFCYNDDKHLIGVRGNWYVLEWFWAHIQKIMEQQKFVPGVSYYRHPASEFSEHARRKDLPVTTEARSISGTNDTPLISMPMSKGGSTIRTKVPSRDTWREPESPTGLEDDNERNSIRLINKDRLAGPVSDLYSSDGDSSDSEIPASLLDKSAEDTVENLSKLSVSAGQPLTNMIVILHDNPDDLRTLDFKYGPLSVSIYTGYITMAETDAIVNAAMGPLINAGGVAGAIANAADPDMQRQCDEYVEKHGSVPTAGVMHTCAGGKISSNVKYIMHTVGPVWSSFLEDKCRRELTLSFLNCMKYANNVLKIQSITMPVISSGIFGCPLEMCVRSFFNAVLLFASDKAAESVTLREVHLVNNNGDSTAMTVLQIRGLIGLDAKSLVAEAKQEISKEVKGVGYEFERTPTDRTQRFNTDAASKTRFDTNKSSYLSPERVSGDTDGLNLDYKTSAQRGGMRNLADPASLSSSGLRSRDYNSSLYRTELGPDYRNPQLSTVGQHSSVGRLGTPTSPVSLEGTNNDLRSGPPTVGLQSISTLSQGHAFGGIKSPVSPSKSRNDPWANLPENEYKSPIAPQSRSTVAGVASYQTQDRSSTTPITTGRPLPPVPSGSSKSTKYNLNYP